MAAEQQAISDVVNYAITRQWYNVWMDFNILDWMLVIGVPIFAIIIPIILLKKRTNPKDNLIDGGQING